MTIPDEAYTRIAVEIAKAVIGVVDLNQMAQIGMDRVTKDVFDFTDAFCEELALRLARNGEQK